MDTAFDRLTEKDREKRLMARVRAGGMTPADLAREGLPFFLKIQIQTASPCNAACAMCPWPDTAAELPQGSMDEALFRRIVDQLAGRGVERTSLFLNNEPTVDRRLERLTAYVKERVPETATRIFTNGMLLDGARAVALAEAGLDEVAFSFVGFSRAAYARYMGGCDFDRAVKNLREIADAQAAGRLRRMEVRVVGLDLPGAAEGADALAAATGFTPYVKTTTTDAGLVDLGKLGLGDRPPRPFRACQRPFVKAYVLYDGGFVLCNADWKRTTVYGNARETPLEDLWRGAFLRRVREAHCAAKLPDDSLCARCDYPYLE